MGVPGQVDILVGPGTSAPAAELAHAIRGELEALGARPRVVRRPRDPAEGMPLLIVAPHEVLHIGDDLALDVHGALAAGLQAAWVVRPDIHPDPVPAPAGTHHVVEDLLTLADRLGV